MNNKMIVLYLLSVNAAGALIMLADKNKARNRQWRIPEATLLTVAAIGGSLGVLFGMYRFHHKTRKPKFCLGVPIILVLQLVLLGQMLF